MNFSKMTIKKASLFGFLIGLASPILLFAPMKINSNSVQHHKNGLDVDEQRIMTDYERTEHANN